MNKDNYLKLSNEFNNYKLKLSSNFQTWEAYPDEVEMVHTYFERNKYYILRWKICPMLIKSLQDLREYIKQPIIINSGLRLPNSNVEVGGKRDSFHMLGRAFDIMAPDWWGHNTIKPKELYDIIIKNPDLFPNIKGLGLGQNFIHMDTRNSNKVITWIY